MLLNKEGLIAQEMSTERHHEWDEIRSPYIYSYYLKKKKSLLAEVEIQIGMRSKNEQVETKLVWGRIPQAVKLYFSFKAIRHVSPVAP